ncbi:hypothetical protein BCR44DRAFT_1433186, partial [Catenaria anguillulae PL171]
MAWVGPIPHSVNQDAALEHLKRKYKSTAIAGEQLVNGSRFYKAIFGNQLDMASAIDQSPHFFRWPVPACCWRCARLGQQARRQGHA